MSQFESIVTVGNEEMKFQFEKQKSEGVVENGFSIEAKVQDDLHGNLPLAESSQEGQDGSFREISDPTQNTSHHSRTSSAQNKGSTVGKRPWHSSQDESDRKSMSLNITSLLQQKKPNATEWLDKLPHMAKRLEEALYFLANSLEEYNDSSTLKSRLQQLAVQMGGKVANSSARSQANESVNSQVPNNPSSATFQKPSSQSIFPIDSHPIQLGSQSLQNSQVTEPFENPKLSTAEHSPRQFINISQINPIVGSQSFIPNNRLDSGSMSHDDHRRQVLKQQQQRLLLLRHASKCENEDNCSITPHCASMKNLWQHIMSCKDQECKVAHCVSSRYVLSHYSKCKDQNCPVCAPVREAIRRNYEKTKQPHPRNGLSSDSQSTEDPPSKKQKLTLTLPFYQKNPSLNSHTRNTNLVHFKLDPISCGLYCLTNDQIQRHIEGIHEGVRITASKVKEICLPILEDIIRIPQTMSIFGVPVDPILLNLPDYFQIVKSPMDLGTVRKKLETLQYRDLNDFIQNVHLTFDNAMLYNPKTSEVHMKAKALKKEFDIKYKSAISTYQKTIEANRLNEDACAICGEIKLTFEPPVYYCNGKCGGQRIRRNAFYYGTANNSFHWCGACFNDLKDNEMIKLPDSQISKADLGKNKKKHTEEAEESWVGCDGCNRWVHGICALFNSRRNFGDQVQYFCPDCLVSKRSVSGDGIMSALTSKTRASDLDQCTLTQFIEQRIHIRLNKAYEEEAQKLNIPVSEVDKCPPLVLRQVSCIDKMQPVREGMRERYSNKNYPTEFPCRTKCLVLFQSVDGQDVILFGMYVYEYGQKCPQPNQRRVYISYLDSVHYFRPKRFRTIVYHEILVSYLDYVKRRGFHTAHIWSCPPSKGDDYILYCHPNDQKIPKPEKLQKWYADMLEIAKARGIVVEVTDLHSEYLTNPSYDATILPYFEGDYWTTEAEVIIKSFSNESKAEKLIDDEFPEGKPESKSKRKSKADVKSEAGRPLRSSKLPSIIFKSNERDVVMAKLSGIIEPMKNTFFVVRLHTKEYADNCVFIQQNEKEMCDYEQPELDRREDSAIIESKSSELDMPSKSSLILTDFDNSQKDSISIETSSSQSEKFELNLRDDTEDVDETQESEHWDTRQSFLTLCQGNHYQFDQLRRAKHTSLMVLYHLHNPDAPKFVPNCNVCHTDILVGNRFRCEACDVDFCQNCHASHGARIHPHNLRPIPTAGSLKVHQLTEAERKERQRTLELHLQLVHHASYCHESSDCSVKNCAKMKEFFKHLQSCASTVKGCPICKRVNSILNVHARSCRQENCQVIKCGEIKENLRRLALRQQQSDDRRRAMCHELYHSGADNSKLGITQDEITSG